MTGHQPSRQDMGASANADRWAPGPWDWWDDGELVRVTEGNYILDSRNIIGYISTSHVDNPVTLKEI